MLNTVKLIVAGSRTATDCNKTIEHILKWWQENSIETELAKLTIISGNARGPDTHGIEFAKQYGQQVEIYPADWDRYGKSAGYKRNELMAQKADALLAIWDGQSKGTKHMIDLAFKYNLQVKIINSITNKEME